MAIISHPDAGKTTLTEKFLLYGGAVQEAGAVKSRKQQRSTTSDWMELERKRGISVSSTVLQFEYGGFMVNLLDTPGHKDFSEDTYRVLTAVDSVIMVIDAGKGIEPQTRKLFEVCRRRGISIFTFMNKLDRPTKEPIELLDELEELLQIEVYPLNWPLGTGFDFQGVYDRLNKQVHLFEKLPGGNAYRAPVCVTDLSDPLVRERLDERTFVQVSEELELLDGVGGELDEDDVGRGGTTPVCFGSALNNFGVQLLLDMFLKYSVSPSARESIEGIVYPEDTKFSGFIFKILANMDPRHRDRIAFLRVCSGRFQRDMTVLHSRTGKKVKLSNARRLFGQERETLEEGYAGDILGLVGNAEFGIGDTLTEDPSIRFDEIPRFTPECFSYLRNPNPSNYKRFRSGVDQLLQEGVIRELIPEFAQQNSRLLAAVGPLQFEVVQYRLENEYGAESRLESTPWQLMRWLSRDLAKDLLSQAILPTQCAIAEESFTGERVLLLPAEWALKMFIERNPDIGVSAY